MRLTVKAHPRSKRERVAQTGEAAYEIWVRPALEDGKANAAVIAALAEHLGVAKSRLVIVRSQTARIKTIWIRPI